MGRKINITSQDASVDLSNKENLETKDITAISKENQIGGAGTESAEKPSSLHPKAACTLKNLHHKCLQLMQYENAMYPTQNSRKTIMTVQDTGASGFTLMDQIAGVTRQEFEQTPKFWGFTGVAEFNSLPNELREDFFCKAVSFVESIFGKHAKGIEELLMIVKNLEDPVQYKLFELKVEDLTTETRAAFIAIAQNVKARAAGYNIPRNST